MIYDIEHKNVGFISIKIKYIARLFTISRLVTK